MPSIQAARRGAGRWGAGLPALPLSLVVGGALADVAGLPLGIFELATLLIAPGLALAALLPESVRRAPVARLAAIPVLGGAAMMTALVNLAYVGVPLTAVSVRCLAAAIVLAGGVVLREAADDDREAWEPLEALGLLAALGVALGLGVAVVGERPVPGNDWAKYVLYADEIRREGSLLIDNPYWQLGVPFREDPGLPALYGSHLLLTGAPAGVLAQGILVVLLAGVAGTFALGRAIGGPLAGVAATGLVAALPITQDMLGWHGLANEGALALIPLALAYAAELVRGRLDARGATGFALIVVALAATHRLSLIVCGFALVLCAVAAPALADRRRTLVALGRTVLATAVLGFGVALDLLARQRTFGGTLPARDYLDTKLDLELVLRDLSPPFAIASGIALLALASPRVRRRALVPALAFLAVALGLAYAWVLDVPLVYLRMAYFLPLGLVVLVGVALAALRPRVLGVAATVVLVAAVGGYAAQQAGNVRSFYAFATPASLRGLDALERDLRPGEPVVTDRCWSFLSTWLLRTPTLPALARQDIQPQAELAGVRIAEAVLRGSPVALRYARSLGVRYVLISPTCVDGRGRRLAPPAVGSVVFESPRLAVLRLPDTRSGLPEP